MQKLLSTNSKLKKDGIHCFGLPPIKTCPYAGACKKFCYARKGFYCYANVAKAQQRRLAATKRPNFADRMVAEIRRDNVKIIRIHDSGDFYSMEYARAWLSIANALPQVKFYSYTKSIPIWNNMSYFGDFPPNLRLIYSYGGLTDRLIGDHRHAVIFETEQDLLKAGYVNASKSDLIALNTTSNKIGIIKH
jgi:hypothetical protein